MVQKSQKSGKATQSTAKGKVSAPGQVTIPAPPATPVTPPPRLLQEEDFSRHQSALNILKSHGIEVANRSVEAVRTQIKERIAEKISELDALQHEEVIVIVNGVPVRRRRRIQV